ncbi:MAG: ATPase [Myxococcales bacterium]
MKKNFILDTNVLLHDVRAIFAFEDNNVCIPIYVIEELDTFKKDISELGRNAREVSRQLDRFREQGRLSDGVTLPSGGRLQVLFTQERLPEAFAVAHAADNAILAVALDLAKREPHCPTIFVTKDTNLRIRADALGIHAEDYDRERYDISELYPGATEVSISGAQMQALFEKGSIPLDGLSPSDGEPFYANEYILLRNLDRPGHTSLARVNGDVNEVGPITPFRDTVWGIRPRNKEQHYTLDALLRDDIKMVTLVGKAGTGKTLLAVAAGLYKVTDESSFSKVLVSRPIFPLGRDIGYLPGDIEQKLTPWMQPIHDNVEFLMGLSKSDKKRGRSYHELMDQDLLAIEPLTYIRGRSIPNQFMIVDEAQNLTPHEVKTVLTRVGDNTKIVFTGDPYQIDNPYVDSVNNGLTYLAQKFKSEKIAAHVSLFKGERSELAELAANLL